MNRSPLRTLSLVLVLLSIITATACSSSSKKEEQLLEELSNLDKDTIFERAENLFADKKYVEARQLFAFVYDSFPNDPLGHKAALRVADTYAVKKDVTNLTEARLRYRDFANRYPNDPDRDYALLMVGHTFSARKLRADRDLSPIREALGAYQQLANLYPDSRYAPEAKDRMGGLKELLADHEWHVATFYYRNKRWIGAQWRLEYIQENYPDYSKIDSVNERILAIEAKLDEAEARYKKLIEERTKKIED
jgi:outer membrane protein assembly factor BamD